MLVAFGGLPGTGKTTVARAVAARCGATYLRIDAIEQTLRSAGVLAGGVGPAGYMVAYALAEANLRLGLTVVADSVNPLNVTRAAWREVAAAARVPIVEVELVCSDVAEHRRRVETRATDLPGLVPPSWAAVLRRDYDAWTAPRTLIDTAALDAEAAAARICAEIERRRGGAAACSPADR
jgi:predicted kinase